MSVEASKTISFDLSGKVAIVTGGASGIGAAMCRALSQAGASLFLADVRAEQGKRLVQELKHSNANTEFFEIDVTDEQRWEALVARTVEKFGGLDILANNAGIESMQFAAETTIEDFRRILDVNVCGTFLGCKNAIKAMRPGGAGGRGGSIINVSSIAGLTGIVALGAYSASKGAVRSMTKSIAVECAKLKTGIRCNSIHPGLIKTEMGARFLQNFVDLGLVPDVAASEAAFLSAVPMGEWGSPSDIAAATVFLASDASRYMTGAELVVDGGYIAV